MKRRPRLSAQDRLAEVKPAELVTIWQRGGAPLGDDDILLLIINAVV
jgi:hypothetical protein